MQLFYSPGAASLAPHIALTEAGLSADLIRVDLEARVVVATGEPYDGVNPMSKVPALRLDDGAILSETAAVLEHIADLAPQARLAPAHGTLARSRMREAMSFIATELHKGFAPMFDPDVPPAFKEHLLEDPRPFVRLASLVDPGPYVLGEGFSVADAHLFAILRLGQHAGLDFGRWPLVEAFIARVAKRPSVQRAMRAEGVLS
jgi:glutathione S-transferase